MFCPSCGTQLPDDALFCTECGNPIPTRKTTDADSTATSATEVIAPDETAEASQTAVESSLAAEVPTQQPDDSNTTATTADAGSEESKSGNRKKAIIIGVVIAVVVIIIAAIVGYNLWSAEQERLADERYEQIESLTNELLDAANAIEPNTGEGADRSVLLQQYTILDEAKNDLLAAEDNGDFVLMDGSNYDVTPVLETIDTKMTQIHDWFAGNYKTTLGNSTFADDANADSMSSEECQAKIDALNALLNLINGETIIWDGQTGEGSEYATLVATIQAQIAKGNELLPAIQAREEEDRKRAEAQAKANNFLGVWTSSASSGTYWNFTEYNFKANGTGTCTSRFMSDPITWSSEPSGSGAVRISVRVGGSSPYSTTFIYNTETDTLRSENGETFTRSSSSIVDSLS